MNVLLVSVDYTDLLSITLPYNRHHFDRVLVVTSHADMHSVQPVVHACSAQLYATDAFYADGAIFNKWRAVEEGLDVLGRDGWLCLMDADVLWPKDAGMQCTPGKLLSPLRRMCPWPTDCGVPTEAEWCKYPVHPNVNEHAGYTQVFHAEDPVLPHPPWHDATWRHAGGADSFFQRLWAPKDKVRPPWECLHLGEAGVNWYGRATPYADGGEHAQSAERRERMRRLWRDRRKCGFSFEKL